MKPTPTLLCLALLALTGCTVISYNRVFPKFTWFWTKEAREQRAESKQEKQYEDSLRTNPTSGSYFSPEKHVDQ